MAEMGARKEKKTLVLNKIDLLQKDRLLAIIQSFADAGYDEIVPLSALTGDGVEELRRALIAHAARRTALLSG